MTADAPSLDLPAADHRALHLSRGRRAVPTTCAALGVGAVYCSPFLQAAAGSDHGYDVVDHDRIDPARGGEQGWQRAGSRPPAAHGLASSSTSCPTTWASPTPAQNAAWWDVLRLGPRSAVRELVRHRLGAAGRIRLPVLGDDVDLADELRSCDGELRYFEHRFPIAPGTEAGATPAPRCTTGSTTSWSTSGGPTPSRTTAGSSPSPTLAGLRVEDPAVSDATHRRDPALGATTDGSTACGSTTRTAWPIPAATCDGWPTAAPDGWITVEKILEPGEAAARDWPVAGTTGYDALAEVERAARRPGGRGRARPTCIASSPATTATAPSSRGGQAVRRRRRSCRPRCAGWPGWSPSVADAGRRALAELLVAFQVYRSYLPAGAEQLDAASPRPRARRPSWPTRSTRWRPRLADPSDELCVRFQQTTGAVMAKGVEDTAYYRYTRLIALNEVGGDPGQFGLRRSSEFHAAQLDRQRAGPAA